MIARLKKYFWIGLVIAAFYTLLSHHFIFYSHTDFDMLKKQELTLEYTFFSMMQSTPEIVLRIDVLRDAGIEDLMLERGMLSEQKLQQILNKIDMEYNQ